METREPIQVGTHSPAIGQPMIQMGMLLNPVDIDQRTRAVDINVAIQMMQAEVAQCRAEFTLLRVILATEIENLLLAREEMQAITKRSDSTVASFHGAYNALEETMRQQLRFMDASIVERNNDLYMRTIMLEQQIARLPETYVWNRFWASIRRFFRRLNGL